MVRNVRPDTRLGAATIQVHTWNKSRFGGAAERVWNIQHTINWKNLNIAISGVYPQYTNMRDWTTGSQQTWYDAPLW